MKSNHPLYQNLQQCLDTLLGRDTHWFRRLVSLIPLAFIGVLILLMTVLDQPGSVPALAGAAAAVMTAPSLLLVLALFVSGGVFVVACLRLSGIWARPKR